MLENIVRAENVDIGIDQSRLVIEDEIEKRSYVTESSDESPSNDLTMKPKLNQSGMMKERPQKKVLSEIKTK